MRDMDASRSADEAGDLSLRNAALASRDFWKNVCEAAADLVFETDRQGRLVFLAPREVLGFKADDLIGHYAADIFGVRSNAASVGFDPFRPTDPIRMRRTWLRRRDGGHDAYAITARPMTGGGGRGIGIDVTEWDAVGRANAAALRGRLMLDRIVFRMRDEILPARAVGVALAELIACTGAEGAAVAGFGASPDGRAEDEVDGAHLAGDGWDLVAPGFSTSVQGDQGWDDEPGDPARVTFWESGGRSVMVCPIRTRFGRPCALLLWRRAASPCSQDDLDLVASLAGALRAPLESDHLQREMTLNVRIDILTGLLTRRAFSEEAERRFDRLDRNAEHATVMSIDLDDFGAINARYGQECGDASLRHVGAVLRDAVRPTDLVARVGSDEFAILLDGADGFAAAERAEAMCRAGAPILLDEQVHRLGVSIGLASRLPRSDESFESLLRRADMAMNHAKHAGKGAWRASQQEIET